MAGHLWHHNSRPEYGRNIIDMILIKTTFHFSKLNVGSLLIFFGKKIEIE